MHRAEHYVVLESDEAGRRAVLRREVSDDAILIGGPFDSRWTDEVREHIRGLQYPLSMDPQAAASYCTRSLREVEGLLEGK